MKLLYLDCFAGISGDMFLGALIDLGVSEGSLRTELAKLKLPGYSIATRHVVKQNISATKFDCEEEHHHHHHDHRGYNEIAGMIENAGLSNRVKRGALSVFRRIGDAEAKIHGIPLEKAHFQEVGAVDAIVDIVGACVALESLGVDEVQSSPPRLGSGFVETAHEKFTVPAPAIANRESRKHRSSTHGLGNRYHRAACTTVNDCHLRAAFTDDSGVFASEVNVLEVRPGRDENCIVCGRCVNPSLNRGLVSRHVSRRTPRVCPAVQTNTVVKRNRTRLNTFDSPTVRTRTTQ